VDVTDAQVQAHHSFATGLSPAAHVDTLRSDRSAADRMAAPIAT
jgi:hypothetical protein